MTKVPSESSNPYFAKAKLHDPEMFFGRQDLLRRVYETVTHRQSVSILGPRGIGKSSFLWYASLPDVQTQFPFDLSRHIFVLLDLRNYLNKTCEDFFHKVSQAIIAVGKRRGLTLHSDDNGEDEFSSILDQAEEQGFFPVLLLDAFDKITLNEHFDPEFFEFLRAHASTGLVTYITATISPLYEVCHRGIAGSPFFNIFYTYKMQALTPEEARGLITIPAVQAGMPFTSDEVELIFQLAGWHPFFIQRVCYLLCEAKRQQFGSEVDIQHLKNQMYEELLPLFKDIWEQLCEPDQKLLQDEARQKENQQRKLPELSESLLFRHFVRKICQVEVFHMNINKLEDALEKIDSPSALGEADLRFMKAVSLYLKQDTLPTVIEKGMAVREVLKEALKRLRGTGSREDMAPDWKHYNILYYRYFKYHLKNGQIAARIGFSVRQYYREREEALEALLKALLEMEHSSNMHSIEE
jgi:hypothetical protein